MPVFNKYIVCNTSAKFTVNLINIGTAGLRIIADTPNTSSNFSEVKNAFYTLNATVI